MEAGFLSAPPSQSRGWEPCGALGSPFPFPPLWPGRAWWHLCNNVSVSPAARTAECTPLRGEWEKPRPPSSAPPRACMPASQESRHRPVTRPQPSHLLSPGAQRNRDGGLVLAGAAGRAAPPSSRGPALTGRMRLCCPGHLRVCRFYPLGFPSSRARGDTGHSSPGVQGLTQAQAEAIGLGHATRGPVCHAGFLTPPFPPQHVLLTHTLAISLPPDTP